MIAGECHIPFEGILNFRDIGGYPTRDGKSVRWRAVYRSAGLSLTSANDVARATNDLRIRSVIDLRSPFDLEREPELGLLVEHDAVTRRHVLLENDEVRKRANAALDNGTFDIGAYYRSIIELAGEGVAAVFRSLSESLDAPVVFHCTLGKDRTGVIAALLLSTLGVEDETVVADYEMTREHLPAITENLRARGKLTPENEARALQALALDPGAIGDMLASVRRQFGSASDYLEAHDLAESVLGRIREGRLVPAG